MVALLPVAGALRAAFQVLVAWIIGARPILVILGVGPAVWRRRLLGLMLEVRLLPVGGHVQWGDVPYPDPPVGPWGSRLALAVSGPLATLSMCVAVFFVLHVAFQARTLNGQPVNSRVVDVPTDAAVVAGIRPGDVIIEIDGERIEYFDEVERIVGRSGGRPLQVTVQRQPPGSEPPVLGVTSTLEGRMILGPEIDERWQTVTLTVPPNPSAKGYRLGVRPRVARLGTDSWLSAVALAASETQSTLRLLFDPTPVDRPIVATGGDVLAPLTHLMALLFIVVLVVNLLLPAHDLHRIVLLLLEGLLRRPASPRAEIVWVRVEVLLLLTLFVLYLAWYVLRATA